MNNTEVVIHIGYHKTGTTFLQKRVFPALPVNLIRSPKVGYLARSQDYDPSHFMGLLNKQYSLNKHAKTVISQEVLSGRPDGDPVLDTYLIAQRLKETFPDAQILIVIRNQLTFILSLYTYRVVHKGLERRSLEDYLEAKFEGGLHEKLQYDKLIEHYMRLFGQEKVLVLPYEQLVEDHKKFIGDILGFMNIDKAIEYDPRKVNVGTRNSQMILINRLFNYPIAMAADLLLKRLLSHEDYSSLVNRYLRFKRTMINPVLMRMSCNSTQIIDFDEEWRRCIFSTFKESNRRLAELIGIDLSNYGYPG